jgi:large subunit ribosomal protein L21
MNLAVIKTGGKQYLVETGSKITIEILKDKEYTAGDTVVFSDVLMTDSGTLSLGTPTIPKASVEGKVISVGRAKKVDVVRFKAKSNYHKRRGHRQPEMKVEITKV